MKTLITLFLSALLASSAVYAEKGEGKGKRGGNAEDRLARMQKHLDLSDDQVSQIRDIRANGGGREDVRAVLTEDQQATMRERHEKRKAAGKGKARPAPPTEEEAEE